MKRNGAKFVVMKYLQYCDLILGSNIVEKYFVIQF